MSKRDEIEGWFASSLLSENESIIGSKRLVLGRLARKISAAIWNEDAVTHTMAEPIQPIVALSDNIANAVPSDDLDSSELEAKLKMLHRKFELAQAVSDQLRANKSQRARMSPEEVRVNNELKKVRLDLQFARTSIEAAERKWHWYSMVPRPNFFHGDILLIRCAMGI